MESAVVIDGAIHCKLVVEPRFEIEENLFDLDENEYFLLLAAGSSLKRMYLNIHINTHVLARNNKYTSTYTY